MKAKFIVFFSILAGLAAVSACRKEDPETYVQATVTFKRLADGFFMQQDDSTALVSVNFKQYPYTPAPEQRALIMYSGMTESKTPVAGFKRTYDVTLLRADATLTKQPVPSCGSDDDKQYGNDFVGLYLNGVFPWTMIEDGYLSVSYAFNGTPVGIPHTLNLVTGSNPDDPYELVFRHNANGDTGSAVRYSGIIAFPLRDLPDTEGETVDLTVKWRSLATGEMEKVTFKYKSRTDWPGE